MGADAPHRQVRGLQRRRDGAGQLQGPLPDRGQPAPADRGHGSWPATPSRRTTGYIFLRAQYDKPLRRCSSQAIAEARASRLPRRAHPGQRLQPRHPPPREHRALHLRRGVGHAERPARASAPTRAARPPHMASAGLWRRPTVVNNVETLCAACPAIVQATAPSGGAPCRARPTRAAPDLRRRRPRAAHRAPGSCRWARPMRELIEEHAGGMRDGFDAARRLPGGASTPFVRPPADRRGHGLRPHEARPARLGTGTLVAARRPAVCPVGMTLNMLQLLRPGVVRLVHAVLRGPAVDGRRAERHRGGPRAARATSTCSPSTCGSWARRSASATSRPSATQAARAPRCELFRDDFERTSRRAAAATATRRPRPPSTPPAGADAAADAADAGRDRHGGARPAPTAR